MNTAAIAAPLPRTRRRLSGRRLLMLAGTALTLSGIAVGAWFGIDAAIGGGKTDAGAATPIYRTWLRPVDVAGLQKQLVAAGYSIEPTRFLHPVTRSALADFLQPSSAHPLSPSLAAALAGTVITARRDPATWNRRFGLDRRTQVVEQPLTGPGGQLDANGNLR